MEPSGREYWFFVRPIMSPVTRLTGPQAHHLATVLRLTPGRKVVLFDGLGVRARAEVDAVTPKEITLRVEDLQHFPPRDRNRIVIAASLARQDRFEWLIAKCTELGVDRICPLRCERTVKLARNVKILPRWEKVIVESAKQCRRLFLPQVDPPRPLEQALVDLARQYPDAAIVWGCLSAPSAGILGQKNNDNDVIALIGPEGGLTDAEESLLKSYDARPVRLTETILRIETAAVALASLFAVARDNQNTP